MAAIARNITELVGRTPLVSINRLGAGLPGRITIGAGSIIGGNVWLTESVPPGSRVGQGRGARARLASSE